MNKLFPNYYTALLNNKNKYSFIVLKLFSNFFYNLFILFIINIFVLELRHVFPILLFTI